MLHIVCRGASSQMGWSFFKHQAPTLQHRHLTPFVAAVPELWHLEPRPVFQGVPPSYPDVFPEPDPVVQPCQQPELDREQASPLSKGSIRKVLDLTST